MANSTTIFKKMDRLEKELLSLRIEAFLKLRKIKDKITIIQKTSGILGEKFSSGVKFEDSIREKWNKELKKLKF